MIYGHCKGAGKVVIYLTLVEHMKENGCEPNIHTYNPLMNGFHKKNDLIQIRKLRGYTMKSTMHVYQPIVLVDDMKLNNVITMDYNNALIVRFICRRMGACSEFLSMDSSALVINFSLPPKGFHFHLRLDVEVTIYKHSIISSRNLLHLYLGHGFIGYLIKLLIYHSRFHVNK